MAVKKCEKCGEKKNLVIHHINGQHYDNRPENRIQICTFCHSEAHVKGFRRYKVGEIKTLEVDKLKVDVKILKIKSVFGTVRYLITPVSGYGKTYVQNKLI